MYSTNDALRELSGTVEDPNRSPYRRDYARLIHSPAFRRLQGKTQLYPGLESDFFRNRLTHSLEVAQIAKSIALRINSTFLHGVRDLMIDPDICEFAGLAHDLGHPPFGHQGEEALDECMRDLGGFEGNAQTLRILSRLEKKVKEDGQINGKRYGLNLCFRTLASILKYNRAIPLNSKDRPSGFEEHPLKGYYLSEEPLVEMIKDNVIKLGYREDFKTVECQIMDIADDIAYSTYDLEDGFKAGFYHPTIFFTYPDQIYENVAHKVSKAINGEFTDNDVREVLFGIFSPIYEFNEEEFLQVELEDISEPYLAFPKVRAISVLGNIINNTVRASKLLGENGYLRTQFTASLVDNALSGVRFKLNEKYPSLSKVFLERETLIKVEVLKNFTYESQILSPRLKVAEYRGKEIVKTLYEVLKGNDGWRLMPSDFQQLYKGAVDPSVKARVIVDFIAGMTDKYAIEFYGRLKSEDPETIFKPF